MASYEEQKEEKVPYHRIWQDVCRFSTCFLGLAADASEWPNSVNSAPISILCCSWVFLSRQVSRVKTFFDVEYGNTKRQLKSHKFEKSCSREPPKLLLSIVYPKPKDARLCTSNSLLYPPLHLDPFPLLPFDHSWG